MKKITNISKHRILFPSVDFTIGPAEIKEVSNELYEFLRNSYYIAEVCVSVNNDENRQKKNKSKSKVKIEDK